MALGLFGKQVADDASTATVYAKDPTKDSLDVALSTVKVDESRCRNINPTKTLLSKSKGTIYMRFGTDKRLHHAVALVLDKPYYSEDATMDILHWYGEVAVHPAEYLPAAAEKPLKCHAISKRSYIEMIKWCQRYASHYHHLEIGHINCRRFVIRLAEYCGVPTSEMDRFHIGDAYYAARDGGAEVLGGVEDISKGRVLTGSARIVTAPVRTATALGGKAAATTASVGASAASAAESVGGAAMLAGHVLGGRGFR